MGGPCGYGQEYWSGKETDWLFKGGSLGLTAADDEMAPNRYSVLPSKVWKIANLSFQLHTPTESGCLDLPACLQHTAADCNNRVSAWLLSPQDRDHTLRYYELLGKAFSVQLGKAGSKFHFEHKVLRGNGHKQHQSRVKRCLPEMLSPWGSFLETSFYWKESHFTLTRWYLIWQLYSSHSTCFASFQVLNMSLNIF